MADVSRIEFPIVHLQQLDFLLGDGAGVVSRYEAGEASAHFKGFVSGSRESCDRYVRVDYFADVPTWGVDTHRSLFTYSPGSGCYKCWSFSTESAEPAIFTGQFDQGSLIMISEPYETPQGLQRLRQSFTPLASGGYFYLRERWNLEGWTKHCSVTFLPPA